MQNVDQRELDKFEKMAAGWWDPQGDFKPIHRLNPLRLNYISAHSNGLTGKRVLDVGCGGGILAEAMAMQRADVTGIDMSTLPLEIAREHAKESDLKIDYRQITVEKMAEKTTALSEQKFDVVTCMEMLEHVPDPASVIASCGRLLKPDGVLFFSTVNRTPKAWALVVLGAEYVLRMLPKGTHDYDKFIRPAELLAWCDRAKLECVDMKGCQYNPLTGRFRHTRDVSANYMGAFRLTT